ncbi:MAG: hypothetical protein LUI06_08765 [Ruminococcus sp.]|nr:hypothetical protein [Ruminococcus sp.]
MKNKVVLRMMVLLAIFCTASFISRSSWALNVSTVYAEEATTNDGSEHTHVYTYEVTKESTCTQAGEATLSCECGDSYTIAIPAIGHSYKTTTVAATYSEKGYTLHTCTRCGYSYKDNYTDVKTVPSVSLKSDFSATDSAVRINWTKVSVANGYQIQRYDLSTKKWTDIKTINSGSIVTFRDSDLESGTTYKYRIRAFVTENGSNYYGTYSSVIITTTDPSKVELKSEFSSTASAIRINWNKVNGASGYRIYRYDSSTKKWTTVKTISDGSKTTYRDSSLSSGKTYKYKVKAYKTLKGTKYWGETSTYITAVTKPDKVSIKTSYTCTSSAIRINWNKVSGASGYRIYRYDSSTKKWTTVKTISDGSKTTYRDSSLSSGKTYKYKVKAYKTLKGTKYWGETSTYITAVTKPDKVSIKTSYTCTSSAIRINWNKVSGASGYRIYRYDSSTKKWTTVKTISDGSKTTYRDSSLSSGKTYKYKVKAYKTLKGTKYWGKSSSVIEAGTKSDDTLYYITSYSNVYDTSYNYSGAVSGSSYYTGYYDPHYEGYYIINYQSSEKLIKQTNAIKRSNAKVLQTGAIGQYGGKIAGYSACGPTAVAILLNSEKNAGWSKDELILYSESHNLNDQGSLRGGGGMTAPKLLTLISGYSNGKYSAKNIYSSTQNRSAELKSQIDNSHRVLVLTCYRSSVITSGGGRHFVVVCGYEVINSTLYFYYADPYYGNGPRSLRRVSSQVLVSSIANATGEPRTMIILN